MDDKLIANIIYRELFAYNIVFLQNIGYISLVDHSASLSLDGSSLRPPYRTVAVYSLYEQFQTPVDLIAVLAQAISVDYQTSYALYDGYIQRNIRDGVLTIPYVMQIRLNDMSILYIDDRMRTALERQQVDQLILRSPSPEVQNGPKRRLRYRLTAAPATWQLVFALVIFLSALFYLVYHFFLSEMII